MEKETMLKTIIYQEKVIQQLCKVLDAVTDGNGPFSLQGPYLINGKKSTWLEYIQENLPKQVE